MIICLNSRDPPPGDRGTVLVFLPGLPEIKLFDQVLQEYCANCKWVLLCVSVCLSVCVYGFTYYCIPSLVIIPLHSSITHEEQKKAFIPIPPGKRKVILATNIAESSITVPDIRYGRSAVPFNYPRHYHAILF